MEDMDSQFMEYPSIFDPLTQFPSDIQPTEVQCLFLFLTENNKSWKDLLMNMILLQSHTWSCR